MKRGTRTNDGASILNITVILCTYNRCQSLATALESLAASQLPDAVKWEILVVDNRSSDRTREVVEDFSSRYPGRFRYIFEKQPGKSHALNTGIREAYGELLAFMDDDVTVAPTWLHNLTAPLKDAEWAGVGGCILPAGTFSPPRWLALDGPYGMAGPLYAHFDLGDKAHELDRPPYGANMAFPKAVFEKYGGFRIDLGPSPGSAMGHDDTELGRRLMDAGERLLYEPTAVVYHQIPENRVSESYFLKWWFDYGRAQVRSTGKRPAILGIPRHYISIPNLVLSHLPRRTLRWMFTVNPKKRFYRKCMVWVVAGWFVETRRLAGFEKSVEVASRQNDKREAST
jgi:glucosyl-dolichyl phosphate glucuronosyltransferase